MKEDVVRIDSRRPVGEMMAALERALARRPMVKYALVDHARDMRERGVSDPPEVYTIIFGNPQVGASYVALNPEAVADMPIRLGLVPAPSGSRVVFRSLERALADHDPRLQEAGRQVDELVRTIVAEAEDSGPAPRSEEA